MPNGRRSPSPRTGWSAGLLCLAAAFAADAAAADPNRVMLGKGDIEFHGCMRASRVRPGVCFWGHKQRAGCKGECGEAVLSGVAGVELACGYRVSGLVLDARSGAPRAGLPIDLVIAGSRRFLARTGEDGRFLIETAPFAGKPGCVERKDFGKMKVEDDTPKVVLLGGFSKRFRAANPGRKLEFRPVDKLAVDYVDRAQ